MSKKSVDSLSILYILSSYRGGFKMFNFSKIRLKDITIFLTAFSAVFSLNCTKGFLDFAKDVQPEGRLEVFKDGQMLSEDDKVSEGDTLTLKMRAKDPNGYIEEMYLYAVSQSFHEDAATPPGELFDPQEIANLQPYVDEGHKVKLLERKPGSDRRQNPDTGNALHHHHSSGEILHEYVFDTNNYSGKIVYLIGRAEDNDYRSVVRTLKITINPSVELTFPEDGKRVNLLAGQSAYHLSYMKAEILKNLTTVGGVTFHKGNGEVLGSGVENGSTFTLNFSDPLALSEGSHEFYAEASYNNGVPNKKSFVSSVEVLPAAPASLELNRTSLTLVEGGIQETFTVKLSQQPLADVTVNLDFDSSEVSVTPEDITFNSSNYNNPRQIQVKALVDEFGEGVHSSELLLRALGSGYDTVAVVRVNISEGGINISPGALSLTEDSSNNSSSLQLSLTAPPGDGNTVDISITTDSQLTSNHGSISFNNNNWDTAQSVTITVIDDTDIEAASYESEVIFEASSGSDVYDGLKKTVNVSIADNDAGALDLSQTSLAVQEAGMGSDNFTIALSKAPLSGTQVTVTVSLADSADSGQVTLTPNLTQFVFTPSNWSTAQTVGVQAVNDSFDENNTHSILLNVASSGAGSGFDGLTENVTVNITDNDTSSINISPTVLSLNEGSGNGSYTVSLGSQPAGNVTISLSPDVSGQITLPSSSLTFTGGNWNTSQTVTVGTVNDSILEGMHTVKVSHTAAGYTASAVEVTVNIADDETGSLVLSSNSLSVDEDGPASDTFTVKLSAQPTANVTVSLSGGNSSSTFTFTPPGPLTFTPANWNTNQTITVTAVMI